MHPAEITVFNASDLVGENTLDEPEKFVPKTTSESIDLDGYKVTIAPKTFMLYKIQ